MRQYRKWIPSFLVMLVIFTVSSVPGQAINALGLGKESYHINGHFILFFILCLTYYKALKDIPLSIVLTGVYSFFDEFHQKYTPFRSSSFFDIYVDIAAAVVAGVILWKFQCILPKKLVTWLTK